MSNQFIDDLKEISAFCDQFEGIVEDINLGPAVVSGRFNNLAIRGAISRRFEVLPYFRPR